jgi:hypothetical protein
LPIHRLGPVVRLGLLAAAAVLTLAGCDEKLSDLTGPSPNLKPTFASIRDEILLSTDAAGRSACVNCHTPGGPAGGLLNFRADDVYARLVNAPSRQKAGAVLVVPGDPDGSYLVQKLEGRAGIVGQRMPFSGPPFLTDGQMFVIRRWIADGAANN